MTAMMRGEATRPIVHYGNHRCPIPRAKYEEKGYKPPYQSLPTKEAYLDPGAPSAQPSAGDLVS
jgi:hypothetical protein